MTWERRGSTFGRAHVLIGVPAAPLAPSSKYLVVVTSEGFGSATRTSFTTGQTFDTTPPSFAGLRAFSPETMTYPIPNDDGGVCSNSCVEASGGVISRIRIEAPAIPSDAAYVALEVSDLDQVLLEELLVSMEQPDLFGFSFCGARSPTLVPGAGYCARMVAYDLAGNRAGDEIVICNEAQACPPRLQSPEWCMPSNDCGAPAEPVPSGGGCAATRTGALMGPLGLALVLLGRRRRRARGRDRR